MSASQEFRDGAAYGAYELAERIVKARGFGLDLDYMDYRDMANAIGLEMGGAIPEASS